MSLKFEHLTPELLFELSKEALLEYNNDINYCRDSYLKLVTIEILEKYQNLTEEEKLITSLTSVIALMVENFFLHEKLLKLNCEQ